MDEFLFGWITKPKMAMTPLDSVLAFTEMAFLVMAFACYFAWRNARRIAQIKKRHSKHCTCLTCMGVYR